MTFAFQIVAMARYFFESRDPDGLMRDEEGLELNSLQAVKLAATRGLGDWAKVAIPVATKGDPQHRGQRRFR
jgi:hypothetical protein